VRKRDFAVSQQAAGWDASRRPFSARDKRNSSE